MRKPVCANNKGADQPAHPRSLISAFVVRCLDSIVPPAVIILQFLSMSPRDSLGSSSVSSRDSLGPRVSPRDSLGPSSVSP